MALLLPVESDAFGRASDAVRSGFVDASQKHALTLPIRVYVVADDAQNVVAVYRQATAAGAQLVVGPLTRRGVTALATAAPVITVPTLALNVPENATAAATQLYVLSLHIESEAEQAAQLALSEGHRKAFTVSSQTALARRAREAFIEAFERGGGHHIAEYAYTTDAATLERMRQAASLGVADMLFFAIDAGRLQVIRTYLQPMPGYGTSQINPVQSEALVVDDVSNVRFVDMPWMVQPDHPAVVKYARGGVRQAPDLERLYALGVDAFRVAENLLAGKVDAEIDGVTGKLKLGADRQFRRGLLVTLIESGKLVVLGETQP